MRVDTPKILIAGLLVTAGLLPCSTGPARGEERGTIPRPVPADAAAGLRCAPDWTPPTVELRAVPGPAPGRVELVVEASDACGIASSFASIDGDVVAGRTHPPWGFVLEAGDEALHACVLVTDRAGNSTTRCTSSEPAAPCVSNTDCAPDETCRKAPGDCDGEGECVTRPEVCPTVYAPVCGCDGVTYGNSCEALGAGTSVQHAGPCDPPDDPGDPDGAPCSSSEDCADDEACRTADGDCDGEGECVTRPEVCPTVFAPVCGCDGRTYDNSCEALGAGVSVDHPGPCG